MSTQEVQTIETIIDVNETVLYDYEITDENIKTNDIKHIAVDIIKLKNFEEEELPEKFKLKVWCKNIYYNLRQFCSSKKNLS